MDQGFDFLINKRVRALESSEAAETSFITFVSLQQTPLTLAKHNVVVFRDVQQTQFKLSELSTCPQGTTYRFGNLSPQQIEIIDDSNTIIVTIVKGEFLKLIKYGTGLSGWIRTFGP